MARFFRRTVERVARAGGTVVADVDPTANATADLRVLSSPFDRLVGSGPAVPPERRQP